jgi:hypothetical protein
MTTRRDPEPCALGLRIKSGRAVAVVLAGGAAAPVVIVRADVDLSDPQVEATKQPYHAGMGKAQQDPSVIARLVDIIERRARQSIDRLLADERLRRHTCRSAGLVVGSTINPETVGNPHIRAHASEGRLFRTVVEEALRSHRVACTVLVEKTLRPSAAKKLDRSPAAVGRTLDSLGQGLGAPWRADEKAAALAAWILL